MQFVVLLYTNVVLVIGLGLTGTLILIFFDSSAGSFNILRALSTSFKLLSSGSLLTD